MSSWGQVQVLILGFQRPSDVSGAPVARLCLGQAGSTGVWYGCSGQGGTGGGTWSSCCRTGSGFRGATLGPLYTALLCLEAV